MTLRVTARKTASCVNLYHRNPNQSHNSVTAQLPIFMEGREELGYMDINHGDICI